MQIVTVTEQNRSLFEQMVPEEFFDPLDKPGHFVLGAIGEDEEGLYAAGVLCFQVEAGSAGDEDMLAGMLQWLYVGSEFRGRGAGDALMEEFFRLLASVGIEAAICDVPFDFAYNDFCLYLEQWGFTFELMDKDEVRVTVEKLTRIPQLFGECASEVLPFCKASGKLQDDAMNIAIRLPNIAPEMEDCLDCCDRDVSCILVKDDRPAGMALVYPVADGILEIAFLRTFPYDAKHMMDLIYFVSAKIRSKYSPDTQLRFTVRNQTTAAIVSSILPNVEPLLVYRGVSLTMEEELPYAD